MSENYGRSFVEWIEAHKSPGSESYLDFKPPRYDDALILASDQYGDTVVVLEPDGTVWYYTSDGAVDPVESIVDGKNGWQHLHTMLQDGIMYLG